MSGDALEPSHFSDEDSFEATFEETRRRQVLLGLELEPAERLRWLERTMVELRELLGKAR